jgi:hypothetical protein
MTWPRIVVGTVAVLTALGALLADVVVPDLAAQHAFNPAWPPHAKFHDAQYVVMSFLLGGLGLALVTRGKLLWAAALLSTPRLGMFGALLIPGTAAYDPEFAGDTVFVLGLHGQLVLALVLLVALVTAAWGSTRRLRAPAG